MTRKIYFIILQLTLSSACTYSQQIDFAHRFEFAGNISYKSSTIDVPSNYNGQTAPPFLSNKTLTILPSVGYYFTPNFQILIEPSYALSIQKTRSYLYSFSLVDQTFRLYQPGLSLGLYCQSVYQERIIPFIGLRVGWIWSKTESEIGLVQTLDQPKWSKPDIAFPSVAGGFKFFVSDNWAVVAQVQYSKRSNWNGSNGIDGEDTDYALGFSVLL